jgi:hypothetical protein
MELPFHLKTLEPLPGTLDTLRYLINEPDFSASVDILQDALGVGDVTFGKAIRRLVTKSYVQMDSAESYRLTDAGRRAAEELLSYDAATGGVSSKQDGRSIEIPARLVVVAQQPLLAGQKAEIIIGASLEDELDAEDLGGGADLLVRLSAINGDPSQTQDASLVLGSAPQHHSFTLTPQPYTAMRVRVEVYQMMPDGEEVAPCGGVYVDLPVTVQAPAGQLAAYGAALALRKTL